MSNSISKCKVMGFAEIVLAGAALATSAPAYSKQGREHGQSTYPVVCDHNDRAWNDRFNASDQDPVLALRYRQAHRAACGSSR